MSGGRLTTDNIELTAAGFLVDRSDANTPLSLARVLAHFNRHGNQEVFPSNDEPEYRVYPEFAAYEEALAIVDVTAREAALHTTYQNLVSLYKTRWLEINGFPDAPQPFRPSRKSTDKKPELEALLSNYSKALQTFQASDGDEAFTQQQIAILSARDELTFYFIEHYGSFQTLNLLYDAYCNSKANPDIAAIRSPIYTDHIFFFQLYQQWLAATSVSEFRKLSEKLRAYIQNLPNMIKGLYLRNEDLTPAVEARLQQSLASELHDEIRTGNAERGFVKDLRRMGTSIAGLPTSYHLPHHGERTTEEEKTIDALKQTATYIFEHFLVDVIGLEKGSELYCELLDKLFFYSSQSAINSSVIAINGLLRENAESTIMRFPNNAGRVSFNKATNTIFFETAAFNTTTDVDLTGTGMFEGNNLLSFSHRIQLNPSRSAILREHSERFFSGHYPAPLSAKNLIFTQNLTLEPVKLDILLLLGIVHPDGKPSSDIALLTHKEIPNSILSQHLLLHPVKNTVHLIYTLYCKFLELASRAEPIAIDEVLDLIVWITDPRNGQNLSEAPEAFPQLVKIFFKLANIKSPAGVTDFLAARANPRSANYIPLESPIYSLLPRVAKDIFMPSPVAPETEASTAAASPATTATPKAPATRAASVPLQLVSARDISDRLLAIERSARLDTATLTRTMNIAFTRAGAGERNAIVAAYFAPPAPESISGSSRRSSSSSGSDTEEEAALSSSVMRHPSFQFLEPGTFYRRVAIQPEYSAADAQKELLVLPQIRDDATLTAAIKELANVKTSHAALTEDRTRAQTLLTAFPDNEAVTNYINFCLARSQANIANRFIRRFNEGLVSDAEFITVLSSHPNTHDHHLNAIQATANAVYLGIIADPQHRQSISPIVLAAMELAQDRRFLADLSQELNDALHQRKPSFITTARYQAQLQYSLMQAKSVGQQFSSNAAMQEVVSDHVANIQRQLGILNRYNYFQQHHYDSVNPHLVTDPNANVKSWVRKFLGVKYHPNIDFLQQMRGFVFDESRHDNSTQLGRDRFRLATAFINLAQGAIGPDEMLFTLNAIRDNAPKWYNVMRQARGESELYENIEFAASEFEHRYARVEKAARRELYASAEKPAATTQVDSYALKRAGDVYGMFASSSADAKAARAKVAASLDIGPKTAGLASFLAHFLVNTRFSKTGRWQRSQRKAFDRAEAARGPRASVDLLGNKPNPRQQTLLAADEKALDKAVRKDMAMRQRMLRENGPRNPRLSRRVC